MNAWPRMVCTIPTIKRRRVLYMITYDLRKNGNGYDLYYEGMNTVFIVIHNGIMYLNTTPEQKRTFLHLHSENKLSDFFTVLRQLQTQFNVDQIIIVSTLQGMASLLTEEEWRRYGFWYDECGLLKSR